TQHWDAEKASWLYGSTQLMHSTIDSKTGKLLKNFNLMKVERYSYNEQANDLILEENVTLKKIQSQRHCNISVGDKVYFMVRYEAFIGCHNTITGKTSLVEIPTEVDANGNFIWKTPQTNDGLNSRGQRNGADSRTLGGGTQKCFLGSPTLINDNIYFTNAIGLTYVVDTKSELTPASILSVNDLGKRGQTWTVNSLSFANGNIYHRSMKSVVCIENK
ncbi:MAG: serine/threonine protein kinase related protein, partial [Lentisphaeraceae bacterium]|nr:serine/threonine protein kinase related protein [Lentisphaeraceae bacterium]